MFSYCESPSDVVLEYYSDVPHWAQSQILHYNAPGEQHIGQMELYLYYPSWIMALVPVQVSVGNPVSCCASETFIQSRQLLLLLGCMSKMNYSYKEQIINIPT